MQSRSPTVWSLASGSVSRGRCSLYQVCILGYGQSTYQKQPRYCTCADSRYVSREDSDYRIGTYSSWHVVRRAAIIIVLFLEFRCLQAAD